MYNREQITAELKKQLAIDLNCEEKDFDKEENVVTVAKANTGRRIYSEQVPFFSMASLGKNAVISANESMKDWLEEWSNEKRGIWLFEYPNIIELMIELQKRGKRIGQSHHMFLPETGMCELQIDFDIAWFEKEDIQNLYGRPEFSNALCERYHEERPDMLAVGAMRGNDIIGLAGCSADTKLFWQIGIDVLPEYRGKGIGTKLVAALKNEVFRRGAIPFYGTGLSNIYSQNIAINCGFYPAWLEVEPWVEPEMPDEK